MTFFSKLFFWRPLHNLRSIWQSDLSQRRRQSTKKFNRFCKSVLQQLKLGKVPYSPVKAKLNPTIPSPNPKKLTRKTLVHQTPWKAHTPLQPQKLPNLGSKVSNSGSIYTSFAANQLIKTVLIEREQLERFYRKFNFSKGHILPSIGEIALKGPFPKNLQK